MMMRYEPSQDILTHPINTSCQCIYLSIRPINTSYQQTLAATRTLLNFNHYPNPNLNLTHHSYTSAGRRRGRRFILYTHLLFLTSNPNVTLTLITTLLTTPIHQQDDEEEEDEDFGDLEKENGHQRSSGRTRRPVTHYGNEGDSPPSTPIY